MSGNAAEGGSDHLSFTAAGYPAIKLTTTGRLRNPNAGLVGDVEEKIDYLRFTAAVQEIADWIRILANPRGPQG